MNCFFLETTFFSIYVSCCLSTPNASDIIGSSDSSIKNVEPTDLKSIVDNSKIEKVICNGKTSGKYYEKYQMKYLGIKPDILPSTSPANATYSLGELVEIWKKSIIY